MRPGSITIRLTKPIPVTVDGGITRWQIGAYHYGKNGSHICIDARCLTSERVIRIKSGSARRGTDPYGNLEATQGTPDGDLLFRIFCRAVRDGSAVVVERFDRATQTRMVTDGRAY